MNRLLLCCFLLCAACTSSRPPSGGFDLGNRKVIGYWHSWRSRTSPYIPLAEVPSYVNQVNLAFAFPESATSNRLVFPHPKQTDRELRAHIRSLQRRGIQVFLSLGGGNHPIELHTIQDRDVFVASLISLVNRYGFNGVDINLEGASTILDPGDRDFRNPTTPKIRHFIQAIQAMDRFYNGRVLLSVAPETQFVTGGYSKYGMEFGGYLPILNALRDQLDLVHMQLYNSGSQYVYTGDPRLPPKQVVERGTADFVVALTEMMILGFPVANDPNAFFEGFPAEKVVVGLPSTPVPMGNGTLAPEVFRQAMVRLLTGKTAGPTQYQMRARRGYPQLRGVMTWSLNWDVRKERGRRSYDFVQTAGEVLEEVLFPEVRRIPEG